MDFFFHEKSFGTSPPFPHKDSKHPLLRNQPRGTGEYPRGSPTTAAAAPRQGWEVAAASQQGTALVSCSQWSLPPPCPLSSWVLAPGVTPKVREEQERPHQSVAQPHQELAGRKGCHCLFAMPWLK